MDRRAFSARLDRVTQRLPAPRADDGRTVGDLLDRIADPELRALAETLLCVVLDPTADETARSEAAGQIWRSGFFDTTRT